MKLTVLRNTIGIQNSTSHLPTFTHNAPWLTSFLFVSRLIWQTQSNFCKSYKASSWLGQNTSPAWFWFKFLKQAHLEGMIHLQGSYGVLFHHRGNPPGKIKLYYLRQMQLPELYTDSLNSPHVIFHMDIVIQILSPKQVIYKVASFCLPGDFFETRIF